MMRAPSNALFCPDPEEIDTDPPIAPDPADINKEPPVELVPLLDPASTDTDPEVVDIESPVRIDTSPLDISDFALEMETDPLEAV
jgi:hypothetical protein